MKKLLILLIALFIFAGCSSEKTIKKQDNIQSDTENDSQNDVANNEVIVNETEPDLDLDDIRKSFNYGIGTLKTSGYSDLRLRDYIEYKQDCYIGLIYSKIVDISGSNKPSDGNKYLFGYFEIFNNTDDTIYLPDGDDFSAYIDDLTANSIDTKYSILKEDRITKLGLVDELDSKCKTYALVGYEINPSFETAEFYYSDFCWKVNSNEINGDRFVYSSLYDYKENFDDRNKTDDIVETNKLSAKVGMYYSTEKNKDNMHLIAFLFDITNKSDISYTFDSIWDDCRLYYHNYLICDEYESDWVINEILEDHCNIDAIEDIKPGKTAKIYFAFEVPFIDGDFKIVSIRKKDVGYKEKGDSIIFKLRVGN